MAASQRVVLNGKLSRFHLNKDLRMQISWIVAPSAGFPRQTGQYGFCPFPLSPAMPKIPVQALPPPPHPRRLLFGFFPADRRARPLQAKVGRGVPTEPRLAADAGGRAATLASGVSKAIESHRGPSKAIGCDRRDSRREGQAEVDAAVVGGLPAGRRSGVSG